VRLEIDLLEARMRAPVFSSRASVEVRPLLLVGLWASDGVVGHGEAAPLRGYDGVGIEDVRAALEDCRGALADSEGTDRSQLLAQCRRLAVLPQAVAAIDLALWDLAGRRAGEPVWRLLGAPEAASIDVNGTIASADRASAAAQAAALRAAGFRCLKVKVGLGDDAGRLAAVRAAAGPDISLRLDANGAWTAEEALASLRALAPAGIELCEEPVSGLEAVRRVSAQSSVRVSIDETAAQPGALDVRACDAVCLKISRCGGISGVLTDARRAQAAGYEVYLASTLDGPLGIAAALHAAAVLGPDRPCGLATLSLFEGRKDPLPASAGQIPAPTGPGLGEGLLDWYGQ
jgi:L-alanine-DL-glutamate epimerase-like enolase superfamily enzyme